ncbi:MAG: GIY-YIG nuclease family protein [Methyloligellaceae bacterium]
MSNWVYILSSQDQGTPYVGVTNDLVRRVTEHRTGVTSGFTGKNNVKHLVYFEQYEDPASAIQREKNLKHWSRAWKVSLIEQANPDWHDLYDGIAS